ncbi:MAG: hypothetical protein CL949_22510 [Erythrobacter sp.]|nr:hypothetical protein [Erythrobacter sp.]
MMKHSDHTIRREAVLTQASREGAGVRAVYRWNTGEISQISVPENFSFDPAAAVRTQVYAQSGVASSGKVE